MHTFRLPFSTLLLTGFLLAAVARQAQAQGACCLPDAACEPAADESECAALGGVFLDGADCADDPCAAGACCSEIACVQTDAYSCITAGRDYIGAGTSCADDPCDIGQGACCQAGDCAELPEQDCLDGGGIFVGPGTICASGVCEPGVCCSPGECIDVFQFQCDESADFLPGGECELGSCDIELGCPLDGLFGQQRDGPNFFNAYTSEASANLQRWENFSGVAGTIGGIRWFGLDLGFTNGNFFECDELDNTFQITFHEDDAGLPGATVCEYAVQATRTPTGLDYLGFELNEYQLTLPEPCVLTHGWISIVGLGDPDCWFLWLSSPDGDDFHYCDNCQEPEQLDDLSFCLLGTFGGVFGACCDQSAGLCADNIEIPDCLNLGEDFVPETLCDDLDPPCDVVLGACCFLDGTCSLETAVACQATGGNWLGAETVCDQCPAAGACCFDFENCSLTTEATCVSKGFTFLGDKTSCADCPGQPQCPGDSLYAQMPQGPDDFVAGTSEVPQFRRWENFTAVGGPVDSLTWWGVDLAFINNVFVECVESDNTFDISFQEDAGGVPGDTVCSYTVTATRTPTGIIYLGTELNEYSATLPEPCTLTNGWVSIVGRGDPQCWFLWMSSIEGDGFSYCDLCIPSEQSLDFAFCLQGTPGGVFGACCDDVTAMCMDDVEIDNCADAALRFSPEETCADLEPPCGVIVGACCFPDATCSIEEELDCLDSGGAWAGANSICSACPCLQPCPAGGIPEGEPVCTDEYDDTFNGGCDADTVAFSPIEMCDTICAEGGVFEQGLDLVPEFDWYEIELHEATTLRWTLDAEYPILGAIVDGNSGCAGAQVLAINVALECETLSLSVVVEPGTYWLVAGAAAASDLAPCGARYTARVDGLPDACLCPSDIDGDGQVGIVDLLSVLASWGPCPGCPEDLDGNGEVDIVDLLQLLADWGPCFSL